MVMILHAINLDFDHIRNKILTIQEVPIMESLTNRLLHVQGLKGGKFQEST